MRRYLLQCVVVGMIATAILAGCRHRSRHWTPAPHDPVRLVSPNGGESWPIGSTQTVTWTPSDTSSLVNIQYSTDGTTWTALAVGTANDGTQSVTVPATPSATARIRVTETASGDNDASDAVFAFAGILVTSPNGGETWVEGTTATVTWDAAGFPGTVDIDYSTDGVTWLSLLAATPNDGSEVVLVPGILSTTVRVMVSATSGSMTDTSDADFSIREMFEDIGAALADVFQCSMAWGDYDGDGDLDLAVAGDTASGSVSRIYRNDGGGVFTDIGAGLTDVGGGASVAWGDFDRDGDLDLVLSGLSAGGPVSIIYRNDGGGVFTDIGAGLTGVYTCALAWGDYDNDGDLDLALSGYNTVLGAISRIYRNDGGGVFTDIGAGLTGVNACSLAWGDFDNDGDLDLALAGFDGGGGLTRIYRNSGGGVFTDITAGLTGVWACSLAWGDYDNDGDLDLAVAGWDGSSRITRIYQNGGGTFTDLVAGLTGVDSASLAWGDYDNDGDLDLAISGFDGSVHATVIYRNGGAGVFTDIGAALPSVSIGSVAWGDYDNDGDLDLAVAGYTGTVRISRILRNNLNVSNMAPSAPAGLGAIPGVGTVALSWTAPADDHSPASGMGYNLRIGTTPGASNTCSPMANSATGHRRISAPGLLQNTSANLTLPSGTYFWSIQAVDTGLVGGAWATEGTFTIP